MLEFASRKQVAFSRILLFAGVMLCALLSFGFGFGVSIPSAFAGESANATNKALVTDGAASVSDVADATSKSVATTSEAASASIESSAENTAAESASATDATAKDASSTTENSTTTSSEAEQTTTTDSTATSTTTTATTGTTDTTATTSTAATTTTSTAATTTTSTAATTTTTTAATTTTTAAKTTTTAAKTAATTTSKTELERKLPAGSKRVTNISTTKWYRLAASAGNSVCLDVAGGSTDWDATIQLWQRNLQLPQLWRFESAGNGYYFLRNAQNDKYLDVKDGSKKSGARVRMWGINKSYAQQWAVYKHKDGSYSLVNRASGLALDMAGGKTKNGTAIRQWSLNFWSGQRFVLMRQFSFIKEGTYSIWSVCSGKYVDVAGNCIEDGTNIHIWSGNGTLAQKFYFENVAENTYRVQSLLTGHFMVNDHGNVDIQNWAKGDGPLWIPEIYGGHLILHAKGIGKVLDVRGGASKSGTNVQTYKRNRTKAQLFSLVATSDFWGGVYFIDQASDWTKVVDIESEAWLDSSWDCGANAVLWTATGAANQRFDFRCVENNIYEIYCVRSGLALDVAEGNWHGRVRQWEPNHSASQRWLISWNKKKRHYEIRSMLQVNGLALDVSEGRIADGTAIQCWDRNYCNAQGWLFNRTVWVDDPRPIRIPQDQQDMMNVANGFSSSTGWLILTNLSTCRVGVFTGGQGNWNLINYMTCSPGAYSSPTVTGVYSVTGHVFSFGSGYTCWYATQFYGNYLFHSVLYNPGSMSDVQDGRLGEHLSHGCVRLALEDARWIYYEVPNGTTVYNYW